MYTYVHLYVRIFVCVLTIYERVLTRSMNLYVSIYVCVFPIYVCVHACVLTIYVRVLTRSMNVYVGIYVCVYVCVYIYTYVCAYIDIDVYIYINITHVLQRCRNVNVKISEHVTILKNCETAKTHRFTTHTE